MERLFLLLLKTLNFLVCVAEPMPFIIALGLIIGRRGHAAFCVFGSRKLLTFTQGAAVAAFFYFPVSYLSIIIPYGTPSNMISSLFEPAALPWLLGGLAWLCALPFISLAHRSLRGIGNQAEDRYNFAIIRNAFIFCLLASAFFFAGLVLEKWPFAGLPLGMDMERAILAIMRYSMRAFFASLCPAGAMALLFCSWFFAHNTHACETDSGKVKDGTLRWFSFWSIAGCLPGLLSNWGLILGSWASGAIKALPAQANLILYALLFQTVALAGWCWIIVRPRYAQWRIAVAFGLTVCAYFWPVLIRPV